MKLLIQLVVILLPWTFRVIVLNKIHGFNISKMSYIGFSLILVDEITLENEARIGHLNVIKGLRSLILKNKATIGNLNWISGFPKNNKKHFCSILSRDPSLFVGEHSAITNRHLIDCTDMVRLGKYSTFAGFRSQILTHSIDVLDGRQSCRTVTIGDYCFVGTGCVLLGGANIPNFCVIGAMSLVAKEFSEQYSLYAGVPAMFIKKLPDDAKYFTRDIGFVL